MTTDELQILFYKHSDEEFIQFDRVANKKSNRPDLHAFLLLDSLVPGDRDMVAAAAHDEIWVDVDLDELSAVATEDIIIELLRCGVGFDSSTDSLHLFV